MGVLESAGRSQRTAQAINVRAVEEKSPDTEMMKSLQASACERKQLFPTYDSGSLITEPEVAGFLVQGASCPIAYRFYITTTKSEREKKSVVDLAYSVSQEAFLKLNDVRGLSLGGEVVQGPGRMNGNLKGTISSQSVGDIGVNIDLSFAAGSGKASLTFTFPKYVAELSAVIAGGKADYVLNGEALTREQFMATVKKAGPAFSEFTQVSAETSATATATGTAEAPQGASSDDTKALQPVPPPAESHPVPPENF